MITQPIQYPAMDTPAPINIVFDGPPGPEGPRFIEVETDDGRSIRVGEWQQRQDGNWGLRIAALPLVTTGVTQVACVDTEQDLLERILKECGNTELFAIHSAGVLHAAALLMGSQTFDLTNIEQEGE